MSSFSSAHFSSAHDASVHAAAGAGFSMPAGGGPANQAYSTRPPARQRSYDREYGNRRPQKRRAQRVVGRRSEPKSVKVTNSLAAFAKANQPNPVTEKGSPGNILGRHHRTVKTRRRLGLNTKH